jgi:hypothetical protein
MDASLIVEGGTIGLAAEYAVAAELCRRGVYAQHTLGHQKRTDLLVFLGDGEMARIEVKASGTPNGRRKGIFGKRAFLVFVDFAAREPDKRPDFYVLSVDDWRVVIKQRVAEFLARNPTKRVVIDEGENVVVWVDENRRGTNIGLHLVQPYREQWSKITTLLPVLPALHRPIAPRSRRNCDRGAGLCAGARRSRF